MSPELTLAVENAYRVFSRYSLSGGIEVCRCNVCVAPEQERLLIKTPLRSISSSLLAEYTNSAHGYGDGKIADDFRYLLPRYFDLIALNDFPTNSLEERTLERLAHARYRDAWQAEEAQAVDRYLDALFASALGSSFECREIRGHLDCEGIDIKCILMLIANAGRDIAPLLARWEATPGRALDLRIAAAAYAINVLRPAVHPAWDECTAAADRQLVAWLARPEIMLRLEDACLREAEPAAASLLSFAEQVVSALVWKAAHPF